MFSSHFWISFWVILKDVFVRRNRSRRGMSLLLELLLGFSMITLVLLVIFQLFPVADRSVSLADRTTQANYLARTVMENQLDKDYSALDVGVPITDSVILTNHTQRRGSALSTEFLYRVEIRKPVAAVEVKDIIVGVSWKQGAADAARPTSVRLQSSKGNLW